MDQLDQMRKSLTVHNLCADLSLEITINSDAHYKRDLK
jgi:histidinol phosphatase-like PHP family hydrolase